MWVSTPRVAHTHTRLPFPLNARPGNRDHRQSRVRERTLLLGSLPRLARLSRVSFKKGSEKNKEVITRAATMSSLFGVGSSTSAEASPSKGNLTSFDLPACPTHRSGTHFSGEKRPSSNPLYFLHCLATRRSQRTQGGGHVLRSQRACPRERAGAHQRSWQLYYFPY